MKKIITQDVLSLDIFRAANRKHCLTCSLYHLLRQVPPTDQEIIRQAVLDPTIEASAITAVLHARYQWPSTHQVITKHRRYGCSVCTLGPLP